MRSGLASRVFLMQVAGRPQDPDARFFAPTAAATTARSAPRGGHPGRRVRRCGAWMGSLRRPGRSGKGSSFSRARPERAAGRPRGFDTKSGSVPILPRSSDSPGMLHGGGRRRRWRREMAGGRGGVKQEQPAAYPASHSPEHWVSHGGLPLSGRDRRPPRPRAPRRLRWRTPAQRWVPPLQPP